MVFSDKNWDAGDSVRSIVVSPDGTCVGAGCGRHVQLWDLHSGKMAVGPLRGHSASVYSVAYSVDGRRIASSSRDRTVRVWDTATGIAVIKPLQGHTERANSVTFSHDGRLIISGSDDKTIRLWDARTGSPAGTPINLGASVYSVAVSPDGRKIVGGGSNKTMKTYDAAMCTMLFRHVGQTGGVTSVMFSPDGCRIASGSYDHTVRIWEASSGSSIGASLKGHTACVNSVAFSPDGRYIASGSDDKTVRVWDAATGAVQTNLSHSHTDEVNAVAFTPDGNTLVSGIDNGTIKVWNIPGARMRGDGKGEITLLSIHDQTPEVYPNELPLFDEITSTTAPEQIVLHLGTRGCANLTDQLDLAACSAYPISSGGFGDIYRCKLKDDTDVAIKTLRLYVDSSEKSQKHMKVGGLIFSVDSVLMIT
ncbi:hypothetical protein FRC12_015491 [Ceratobasidium sp. 428]|nr:hypothetical protein FRC12_015491 [Ceratobasidium sp. 428]